MNRLTLLYIIVIALALSGCLSRYSWWAQDPPMDYAPTNDPVMEAPVLGMPWIATNAPMLLPPANDPWPSEPVKQGWEEYRD